MKRLFLATLLALLSYGVLAQPFFRDQPTGIGSTPTFGGIKLGTSSDLQLTRKGAGQLLISGDGTGATTNAGWIAGYFGATGESGLWSSTLTPSSTNFSVWTNGSATKINGPSGTIELRASNAIVLTVGASSITAAQPLGVAAITGNTSIDSSAAANLVLKYNGVSTLTVGAANTPVTIAGLTTGTNADTLCLSSGGVVLIQAAACTISSLRFKENVAPYQGRALDTVRHLYPISFTMRVDRPNADWNYDKPQVGLAAENVADVLPLAAIYEQDGATPKSYRQEAVIAVLVKAVQELSDRLRQLEGIQDASATLAASR